MVTGLMGNIVINQKTTISGIGMLDITALGALDSLLEEEWKLIQHLEEDKNQPLYAPRKKIYFQLPDNKLLETDTINEAIIDRSIRSEHVSSMTVIMQKGHIDVSLFAYFSPLADQTLTINIEAKPQRNGDALRIFNRLCTWTEGIVAPAYQQLIKVFVGPLTSLAAMLFIFSLLRFLFMIFLHRLTLNDIYDNLLLISFTAAPFFYLIALLNCKISAFEVGEGKVSFSRYKFNNYLLFKVIPLGVGSLVVGAIILEPFKASIMTWLRSLGHG